MPCPPSPPSTFCHEKVATSILSQRCRKRTPRWCVGEAEPVAAGRDPVGVRNAHARGGAVPGEQHVVDQRDRCRDRGAGRNRRRAQSRLASSLSCLTASVTQPSPKLSQASAVTPRAPSIVHIAISNAPVSEPGTMPMRCVLGQLQHSRASGRCSTAAASCRSCARCERPSDCGGELVGGIAGRLGAGTGGKERTRRLPAGAAGTSVM